jgi:hypothetical protein
MSGFIHAGEAFMQALCDVLSSTDRFQRQQLVRSIARPRRRWGRQWRRQLWRL